MYVSNIWKSRYSVIWEMYDVNGLKNIVLVPDSARFPVEADL